MARSGDEVADAGTDRPRDEEPDGRSDPAPETSAGEEPDPQPPAQTLRAATASAETSSFVFAATEPPPESTTAVVDLTKAPEAPTAVVDVPDRPGSEAPTGIIEVPGRGAESATTGVIEPAALQEANAGAVTQSVTLPPVPVAPPASEITDPSGHYRAFGAGPTTAETTRVGPPGPPEPPVRDASAGPARSPLAAALLNLTGLGLGYAYLGRWWRLVLHLAVTAALVVIAFVTGAAALPWAWVAVAAVWLGWMAVDGWRVARAHHPAPRRAVGRIVPVAVALLAVAAVAAGYVFYGLAGQQAYDRASAARDGGDCRSAGAQYTVVTTWFELVPNDVVSRSEHDHEECVRLVAADEAAVAGDWPGAVAQYAAFLGTRPTPALEPFVRERRHSAYQSWADSLQSAGNLGEAIRVYGEYLDVLGDVPAADPVRESLAEVHLVRAEQAVASLPGLTGTLLATTLGSAFDDLIIVYRELSDTAVATSVPQRIEQAYAAAQSTANAGPACDALSMVDSAVASAEPELATVAATANVDRVRLYYACGNEEYAAGNWSGAESRFTVVVNEYPADPSAAQARASAIAARAASVAGRNIPLPGPYVGDNPGPIEVTFYNDSPEETRVWYVGPTAHEIVLPPSPGSPASYSVPFAGSEAPACPNPDVLPAYTITVDPGVYTIVSERDTDREPVVADRPTDPGFFYTECLYIESDF